jgi:hypothetical protein
MVSDITKYFRENHYHGIYIFEVGESGSFFSTAVESGDEEYSWCILALEQGKEELRLAEESRGDY